MKSNKKADRIRDMFTSLNGNSRQRWEMINQQGHDFYLDDQLSKNEKELLENQCMPTFTINRIIPIVEMLNFYVTANQPRWQAIGADGSDIAVASVHADIADYIWYESDGQGKFSQVINDAITKSVGYLKVSVNAHADHGLGDVVIDTIEPFDVYVDPRARDILYRDAAYIMVKKIMPQSHLIKIFPEYKSKLMNATSGDNGEVNYSQAAEGSTFQYKDVEDEEFEYLGSDPRTNTYAK